MVKVTGGGLSLLTSSDTVWAKAGSVTLNAAGALHLGGSSTMKSDTGVTITVGTDATLDGQAAVTADDGRRRPDLGCGTLTITNATVHALDGAITLTSTAGSVVIQTGSTITAAGTSGSVTITAGGSGHDLSVLGSSTITAATTVTLTAAHGVTITSSSLDARSGLLSIAATAGALRIGGASMVTGDTGVTITVGTRCDARRAVRRDCDDRQTSA